jgi:hypothetical protein
MDPQFRQKYNAIFTDTLFASYQEELERRTGTRFDFRLAETPVFLPDELRTKIERAAGEIVEQLSDPALIERMKAAIPEKWDAPGMDHLPSFAQVDFAIVRETDGSLGVRLIELQGFPSLTSLEVLQRDAWQQLLEQTAEFRGIEWSCWFSHSREEFLDFARRTIVGDHDPADVILLDLDPPSQKTSPDFAATKLLFDVDAVCPTDLVRKGRELWRRNPSGDGLRRVRRIYNRIVFDELEAKKIDLPFDYREPLDVEWTPHPNWYWVWSKYSVPFLDHPAVPKATFVSDLASIPDDLSRYVLKPLFSFAGGGVNVEPVKADVEAIPADQRRNWCLQEKITYEPVLQAVDGGGVKVELRTMFLRPDDEQKLVLSQNLCRLSRGKMLGVDFNRDFTWVGGTVALWPARR